MKLQRFGELIDSSSWQDERWTQTLQRNQVATLALAYSQESLALLAHSVLSRPGQDRALSFRENAFRSILDIDVYKLDTRKTVRLTREGLDSIFNVKTELRNTLSFVGGPNAKLANFIPPASALIPRCFNILDRALLSVKSPLNAAFVRYLALLTIHPLRDANGRLARLFLVCAFH